MKLRLTINLESLYKANSVEVELYEMTEGTGLSQES